jgi:hypothetical protein
MSAKLVAVTILVLVVLAAILYAGVQQISVAQAQSKGPHLIVEFLAGNQPAFQYVLTSVAPGLFPGDTIDLYDLSNLQAQVPASTLNSEASQLAAAAPAGVSIVAHTGLIPNVQSLASGISSQFSGVAATYEPEGATGEGTYSPSVALQYFQNLTTVAHGAGFQSIAYPTGDPLLNNVGATWNYGTFAAAVDQEWVETQQYAIQAVNDSAVWSNALSALIAQFNGAGQPLSKLAVQITLGNDNHGTGNDPAVALKAISMAVAAGISHIYLWTGVGYNSWLGQTISGLNRTASVIPPCSVCSTTGTVTFLGYPVSWWFSGMLLIGGGLVVWLMPGYWKAVSIPLFAGGAALLVFASGVPIP